MIRSILIPIGAAMVLLSPALAHAQAGDNPLGSCRTGNIEYTGPFSFLPEGGFVEENVVINCDDSKLFADRVEWTATTVIAIGNVLLQQPGLHVSADRIEMDRRTRFGTFYGAAGWARVAGSTQANRSAFGSFESDLMFSAEKLERIGPDTYRLTRGWFSSCLQPAPRWEITTTSGTITLNERVLAKNAVLRVKKIPVFYAPIIYYPLGSDERSTGFLMPSYGASTVHGSSISNAFFLVLGRSQDLTFFHNWYSKGGQGGGAEYRFVSGPGSDGNMQITTFNDRALATQTYNVRGSLNQRLGRYFQLIGRSNYVSNQQTQQSFEQNLYERSQRERYFGATLTGNAGRYRLMANAEQRDYFDGLFAANRQSQLPSVQMSVGLKPIGRSRVYFGMNNDATYFIRENDLQPETDRRILRFDTAPTIRAPLSRLPFLSISTSASLRLTYWRGEQQLVAEGEEPIRPFTRHLADLRADIEGPVFAKIWTPKENGYADRYKHLIEPRLSVSWLSSFDPLDKRLEIDQVDQLVGGTTTVTYGLVNRLLARRKVATGRGPVHDIFSVSISQSRYSEPLAAAVDSTYQSTTVGTFSPVQIRTNVSPGEGFNGRFEMYLDSKTLQVQTYSASATAGRERNQFTAGWSKRQFLPDVPGFDNPDFASHFVNFGVSTHSTSGRIGGNYAFNYDIKNRSLLTQRVVLHLNAQCCGISLDYQTIRRGVYGSIVLPADRKFGISFSLAGLGSFSNPFGSFGDNSGRR